MIEPTPKQVEQLVRKLSSMRKVEKARYVLSLLLPCKDALEKVDGVEIEGGYGIGLKASGAVRIALAKLKEIGL